MKINCSLVASQDLRRHFPMLQSKIDGKDLIYLNSAATALKPQAVIDAMSDYYRNYGVNIARGVDKVSFRATQAFENTRHKVAKFLNARQSEEIIFTRGTTAGINLVCQSLGENIIQADDEIIVSATEHHANYLPWQQLAKRKQAKLVVLQPNENGEITPEILASALNKRTKIVALFHISNVLGAKNNLKALAAQTHMYNAYFIVDGAQGIVHEPVDVQDSGVDFYAFSGHKLFGPTGVGVLYGRFEHLLKMSPVEFGGEMIDVVEIYDTSFALPPHRFEAGTMPIAEVIGLGKAIDFVQEIGYDSMQKRIEYLTKKLVTGLATQPNIKIFNPNNYASGIVSFNVDGIHPHDVAGIYDRDGISVRAGQHCSQPTMFYLGQNATLRVSIGFYNVEEEVDEFLRITTEAGDFLDVLF